MARALLILLLATGACGRSDSSQSKPETEGDPKAAAPQLESAGWPADGARWRSIKGECTGNEGHESWCSMPAHTDVPALGAFLEARPALVLSLARDPGLREGIDELFVYVVAGDPARGTGRVGGIAAGAVGVVVAAMLEGWKRPGVDELRQVLREVLASGDDVEPIIVGMAKRSEMPESEIAGDTPAARLASATRGALADVLEREAERLHIDFSAHTCDRSKEGADDTLPCRYETMSADFTKMLAELTR